ncbi:hypothetical protein [Thiolapillus sp.]|uniref:hypothetical protein n=1 Tax=Thiolapillus sp. TaxID=2017437 RepID=UPI003AF647D4
MTSKKLSVPTWPNWIYGLTDISKPGDGNRITRKALDRNHLAGGSPRAQTIKLADLIDNARDICKHDRNFSQVYLSEMAALLDVLQKGNGELMRRARKILQKCMDELGMPAIHPPPEFSTTSSSTDALGFSRRRVQRLFSEAFTAKDIAEPLPSFDADRDGREIRKLMQEAGLQVAGVRDRGMVSCYIRSSDLEEAARPLPCTGQRFSGRPADLRRRQPVRCNPYTQPPRPLFRQRNYSPLSA